MRVGGRFHRNKITERPARNQNENAAEMSALLCSLCFYTVFAISTCSILPRPSWVLTSAKPWRVQSLLPLYQWPACESGKVGTVRGNTAMCLCSGDKNKKQIMANVLATHRKRRWGREYNFGVWLMMLLIEKNLIALLYKLNVWAQSIRSMLLRTPPQKINLVLGGLLRDSNAFLLIEIWIWHFSTIFVLYEQLWKPRQVLIKLYWYFLRWWYLIER